MKILSKFRDRIRNFLYKSKYDFINDDAVDFCWRNIRSVVICKVDGKLGDAEVISPFIYTLQNKFPKIELTVISSGQIADVYKNCFGVNRVIVCCRRPGKKEIEGIVGQLERCDLYITLEDKFRFHDYYLLYRIRPRYVAGINSSVSSINLNMTRNTDGDHITSYFAGLLKKGGLKAEELSDRYHPILTEKALERVKEFCASNQVSFAPWGASKHRRLKDGVVEFIVEKLQAKGYRVALLLPPGEHELKKRIESSELGKGLVNIPDALSVYELGGILSLSKALISVDTANVHLACSFGLPIFGIYSGNKPYPFKLWGPKPGCENTTIFYKEGKMIDQLTYSDIKNKLEIFICGLNTEC